MSDRKFGTCGDGRKLDGKIVGCGEPFNYHEEAFRCTDCEVAFHRHCARDHFARSQTNEGTRNLERDIGDYIFSQADNNEVIFRIAQAVRTGRWRP